MRIYLKNMLLQWNSIDPILGLRCCKFASPLYFLQHCQGGNMHTLNELLWMYTYMARFAKFLCSRYVRSIFMGIFEWNVARRLKICCLKPLEMEYAIRSRVFLRFRSNFETTLKMIVRICWKSWISSFDPSQRKNQNFPRYFLWMIFQWGLIS